MLPIPPNATVLELRLEGPAVAGRIRVDALAPLAKGLQTLLRRVLASPQRRAGRFAREIEELGALELVGFAEGSAVLRFEFARSPERENSIDDPSRAVAEELVLLLQRAETNAPGWSSRISESVLDGMSFLADALEDGIEGIELEVRQAAAQASATLTRAFRDHLRLATRAMSTRSSTMLEASFEGVLWECNWRERTAQLELADGTRVLLRLGDGLDERATELRRQRVRVSGIVERRESRGLSVVVRALEPSQSAFAVPDPRYGSFWENLSAEELARRQGVTPIEDLSKLAGDWPPEDSFEEFLEFVREGRGR